MREDFALVRSLLDDPPQQEKSDEPVVEPAQMELFG
jgi:hypothetical protein